MRWLENSVICVTDSSISWYSGLIMMCEPSMSVSVSTLYWSPLVAEEEEELTGWESVVTVADCSPTLPAISKTFNSSKIITLQGLSSRESGLCRRGNISDSKSGGWGLGDNVHTGPSWPGNGGRGQTPGTCDERRQWELVTTLAGEGKE